ncbi:MAG: hypothetical protein ACOYM3_26260 [Terrimicrobiaceae bacterium]
MTNDVLALTGLITLATATVIGIFVTKTPGFGKYTVSVLLLSIVFFVAGLFLMVGKIEATAFTNVAFAVIGFAGGLFTTRNEG